MPPGPSVYESETGALADLDVVELLADARSLALPPRLRRGDFVSENPSRKPSQTGYVFNPIEPRRRLCRDVLALAHEVLGETLFDTVHQDEAAAAEAVVNRVHDSLTPAG